MSHQTSLEVIAPTVAEALERGLKELGATADAVEMEVLDAGSRGFLGLGSRQVRIRLTLKDTSAAPAEDAEDAPAAAGEVEDVPEVQESPSQPEPEETDATLELVEEHVHRLLKHMDIPYQSVDIYRDAEDAQIVHVNIHGKDLNMLVGRRAEVLNAFQYILSLIVGRYEERWVQIVVDVEGYRERRARSLRRLAERMADQAVRLGYEQPLEPMPANERRIVHLALRDRDDVETHSVGEEPHRKVLIKPRQK